jgi:sec-independent protein translocase protein TatB
VSFSDTIFLFFLALVLFGPKKLPEIARQVGKILNEFRRASNEFKSQIEQEIAHLEVENRKQEALKASPAPEGTASRTLNAAPSVASSGNAPATLAAAPGSTGGNGSGPPVAAAEAGPAAEPIPVDTVNSASPETSSSLLPSSASPNIPKEDSQNTSPSHLQSTQPESQRESQESHA